MILTVQELFNRATPGNLVDEYQEIFNDLIRDHGWPINEARVFAKKQVVAQKIREAKTIEELSHYTALMLDPTSRW